MVYAIVQIAGLAAICDGYLTLMIVLCYLPICYFSIISATFVTSIHIFLQDGFL